MIRNNSNSSGSSSDNGMNYAGCFYLGAYN